MRPRIAQDTADFRELREKGYVYVDKTEQLYRLVNGIDIGGKLFFISRPRRFGKSLMLSTLACIFRGQRELFKGLAIDKLDYDWTEYPILHFSFAGIKIETLEAFEADFRRCVKKVLTEAKCKWNEADFPSANFAQAITDLAKQAGKPVVILIDEYDAPVSHALADIKLATAIRRELSDFYIQIKEYASDIRFMMMTGVTKFTQLSVFSALNNLNNLTMNDRYATLLGYTDDELTTYFEPAMRRHAEIMGLSYEDYREQLRWWYNGYRFARWNTTKVYNPCAIGKTLGTCTPEFLGTWTSTGLTSVVFNYFANNQLADQDYENIEGVFEEDLDVGELENIQPTAMLYQGGYLTIKDYKNGVFTLGIPDEEVRRAFNTQLIKKFTGQGSNRYLSIVSRALMQADFDTFFGNLSDLYAHLTYGPKEERVQEFTFQRILYVTAAQTWSPRPPNASSSSSSRLTARPKRPSRKSRKRVTPSPTATAARKSTSSASPSTTKPAVSPAPSPSRSTDFHEDTKERKGLGTRGGLRRPGEQRTERADAKRQTFHGYRERAASARQAGRCARAA